MLAQIALKDGLAVASRRPQVLEQMTTGTPLDGERYISLETFRKDGTGVKTPVWAAALRGKLVVGTGGASHKVTRLRNDPKIRVAACDARGNVRGPWQQGTARILEGTDAAEADSALARKYGFQYALLNLFSAITGRKKRRAFLELIL